MPAFELNTVIFIVGAIVLGLLVVMGVIFLGPRFASRSTIKKRLALVSGQPMKRTGGMAKATRGGSRKRDIQTRLKEADQAKQEKVPLSVKYRRDLRQAGFKISLRNFLIVCVVLFFVAMVGYLIMGYPKIGLVPFAVAVGFGIPYWWVKRSGRRRTNKFTLLFADAVDVIVRGIRSGLPVGECLNIIARETAAPVNLVFQEIVEATKLGLPLDVSLERALEQMSTAELKFFNIVLSIQAQTGGNLADTLGNLSSILRDRKKMKDKVQALSQEAKSSASIIGSLPFIVTALLWLVSPEYINLLFTDNMGQIMVMGGIIWMSMGILVMKQMINFDI